MDFVEGKGEEGDGFEYINVSLLQFFRDGISRALPEHPIPWDMYALDDIDSRSNSNYSKRKKRKKKKNNHRPPARPPSCSH